MSLLLLLFLPLSCFACPPLIEPPKQTRETPYEYFLPKNVKPFRYRITLQPDLELETIEGSVVIDLEALENTKNITVEIRSVTIESSSVVVTRNATGEEVRHGDPTWLEDVEHYVINLDEELIEGENYTLTVGKYEGKLHSDNGGFYLAKYIDEDGNERRLATTQFQSTNARRAFPCFDEPALKATFLVNLIHPENYSSISNEIVESESLYRDGYVLDRYKETVRMSTYLAAFVVSDFDYAEKGNQKVYARPQAIKEGLGDYALQAGIDVLEFLAEYLHYPYTASKMDQIAFPDDYFAAGAMENWGLVTYKEVNLLYSEDFSTDAEQQRVLTVIAHEFAHQWFGNLVTLAWWEYLWLNEGFATYFQYFAAGEMEPDWRLMELFVPDALQYALEYDATDSTEPLNYATPYPGGGAPTYVSYQKGASVIRMFEHFLTTDVFQSALKLYLKNREYDAVVPDDLYDAIQQTVAESGKADLLGGYNVSTILESWDSFKGYPVVTIERDYESGYLTVTQERFFQEQSTSNDTHVWYIPLNFAFDVEDFASTTIEEWFTTSNLIINNSYPKDGWLIANKRQTGFYRVNYDHTNWQRIIEYLKSEYFENIHVLNRAQLIDDVFDLARSGRLSYEFALDLSSYMDQETNYIVWYAFLNNVDFLDVKLSASETYETFKTHIIQLSEALYDSLGSQESPEDSHLDKLSRSKILPYLCRYGHEECKEAALKSLRDWEANDEQMVPPNLQTAFFCAAIAEGNSDDWEFLFGKYLETPQTRSNQRSRIISGLGCSSDETILRRYMDLALEANSTLESKHKTSVFSAVYKSGKTGLQVAFDYVKDNYVAVKNSGYLSTILSGIGSLLTTEEQLDELKTFAEEHADDNSQFTSAIANAESNVNWRKANANLVQEWLETRVRSAGGRATGGNIIFYVFLYTLANYIVSSIE